MQSFYKLVNEVQSYVTGYAASHPDAMQPKDMETLTSNLLTIGQYVREMGQAFWDAADDSVKYFNGVITKEDLDSRNMNRFDHMNSLFETVKSAVKAINDLCSDFEVPQFLPDSDSEAQIRNYMDRLFTNMNDAVSTGDLSDWSFDTLVVASCEEPKHMDAVDYVRELAGGKGFISAEGMDVPF